MQEINLLPKRPLIERFAPFIIFVILIVGGGTFAYLFVDYGFIADDNERLAQSLDRLQGDVSRLEKKLADLVPLRQMVEKAHKTEELKGERIHWKPIIEAIYEQDDSAALFEIKHAKYTNGAIDLHITFNALAQLQQYERRLLLSPIIEQMDIKQTTLIMYMEGHREYNGNVKIKLVQ